MWRNWQTRRFQVPVGNRVGSNPFIRTTQAHPLWVRFFRGVDEEQIRFQGSREEGECPTTLSEGPL